jgi:hypothetical protein
LQPLTSAAEERNIVNLRDGEEAFSYQPTFAPMPLLLTAARTHATALAGWTHGGGRLASLLLVTWQFSPKKNDVFNVLWALVFGFATLNILGLVARRFEPERNRLSFGESMAVLVVVVSLVLLGWEMLTLFKIFPIRLHPR